MARFSDDKHSETSFHGSLEIWNLASADGTLVYDAYFYQADSGSFFLANTCDVVCEVIQGYLHTQTPHGSPDIQRAIDAAARRYVASVETEIALPYRPPR